MALKRRVAVTGLGVISPLGRGLATNWAQLVEGKSGISRISRFDSSAFRTQIAGEVRNFRPDDVIPPKEIRTMDLFIQYALVAAHEALLQSGLVSERAPIPEELQSRAGSVIGCGLGGLPEIEATHKLLQERGPSRVSPFFIPKLISNLASGQVAIPYRLMGPNFCTTSACASGAHAIGESYRMICEGHADIMVTGGTEATITELCVGGFNAMRALSTRNEEPERASRPFDRDRDGFVVGEGSGIMVLEEWELAKKRGANILAELVGYAANCDAFHLTAPAENGAGAGQCMEMAIRNAEIHASDISAINAHGTSTGLGDIAETRAIKSVFKDHARKLKVTSTKSMTGHTLGAAGGIEAIYSVQCLREQKITPTINLENPDPDCDLDYVPNTTQELKHSYILSNSFGFGGTNACLIFKRV